MEQWCYDNPDLDAFDEIDSRYNEFYLKAKPQAVTFSNNISLIQVQNTSVQPIPFLLSGNNLKEKNISIVHVEKAQLSLYYEVIIQVNDVSNLPKTLQLNAFWIDNEDWCGPVDSTQYFIKVDQTTIRFRFKHLSQKFNGFFMLIDPGYKMSGFIPDFEPDYAAKEEDFRILKKKRTGVLKSEENGDKEPIKKDDVTNKQHNYHVVTDVRNEPIKIQIPEEETEGDGWKFLLLKIGIYAFVFGPFFFGMFGPGLIRSCKQQKEFELITLGGSRSEADQAIEDYNKCIALLNKLTNRVINKFGSILIYTNDTSINNCTVYPNINYSVFEEVSLGRPMIQRYKDIIEEIDFFSEHMDSLGFNFWLSIPGSSLKIAELNQIKAEKEFIVLSFYYYSEEEKSYLKKRIEKQPLRSFQYPHKSKNEQLKDLDEIQCSKVILSETELKNQSIESGLKALFAPRKGSINSSQRFYFAVYNSQTSDDEFKKDVRLFVDMFLAHKDTTGCFVKKIPLRKFN